MTGKKNPRKWQDKHVRKMESLVHNEAFQQDLAQIGITTEFMPLYRLAEKYDVQPTLIYEYIKSKMIEPSAISPTMSIICDDDETSGPTDSLEMAQYNYIAMRKFSHPGVQLYIPPGSDKEEIKSFIKDNWEYIETKIGKPKKIRRSPAAERDAEVAKLKKSDMKNAEIAKVINDDPRFENLKSITYADIPRIIKGKA